MILRITLSKCNINLYYCPCLPFAQDRSTRFCYHEANVLRHNLHTYVRLITFHTDDILGSANSTRLPRMMIKIVLLKFHDLFLYSYFCNNFYEVFIIVFQMLRPNFTFLTRDQNFCNTNTQTIITSSNKIDIHCIVYNVSP